MDFQLCIFLYDDLLDYIEKDALIVESVEKIWRGIL